MKKVVLTAVAALCAMNSTYAMAPIDDVNVKAAQTFGLSQKNTTTDKMLAPWTVKDRKQTNKFGNNERAIVYSPYVTVAVNAQNDGKAGKTPTLQESTALAKEYDGILSVGLMLNSSFKVEPKLLKIRAYQGDDVYEPYATTLEKATVSTVHKTVAASETKKNAAGISAEEKAKLAAVKKDVEAKAKVSVKNAKPAAKAEEKAKTQTSTKTTPNAKTVKAAGPVVSNVPTPTTPRTSVAVKVWNLQYFTYFDLSKLDAKKHVVLKVTDQGAGEREFLLDLPNLK